MRKHTVKVDQLTTLEWDYAIDCGRFVSYSHLVRQIWKAYQKRHPKYDLRVRMMDGKIDRGRVTKVHENKD